MPNPYLPNHEYIPDGEPRVFGERVYIYGSHDNAGSDKFCDYKLKVWSASVNDLNNWQCHGDIFHTKADRDHPADIDRETHDLYAPDVVEKDGKYYLYAYLMGAKGCVAVSERPEGPFKLISEYKYNIPEGEEDYCNNGWFIDPGTLVDDDGRVYVYCGFQRSWMVEVNAENMYEVIDGTYINHIIPLDAPFNFFEACSPRKIGDTYYMIYSPNPGSQLVYATSKSPRGPFEYGGIIVDNGADFPGGNNHGSICKIGNEWYIFYHRMTNGTIMSRRACVERIKITPDGKIPQVEMTSLGFEKSLSPYKTTPADIACVLKGGCIITEKDIFTRPIINITNDCIIGYKYFDFGDDFSSKTMEFFADIKGMGMNSQIHINIDAYDESGTEIGVCKIGLGDGIYSSVIKNVTGVHSIFFIIKDLSGGWFKDSFKNRHLFEFNSFVFVK
ncbi:MAG: family 43 glycosylhydrolase [Defluviitaleaceae bacterium]|nr:family 43 glycosylhydrolase [Defluviitaleaceae bacterium]